MNDMHPRRFIVTVKNENEEIYDEEWDASNFVVDPSGALLIMSHIAPRLVVAYSPGRWLEITEVLV